MGKPRGQLSKPFLAVLLSFLVVLIATVLMNYARGSVPVWWMTVVTLAFVAVFVCGILDAVVKILGHRHIALDLLLSRDVYIAIGLLVAAIVFGILTGKVSSAIGTRQAASTPLCIVCEQPATQKSEGVYIIKGARSYQTFPSLGVPAWLCATCPAPDSIKDKRPVIRGAYSTFTAIRSTWILQLFRILTILAIVVCVGLVGLIWKGDAPWH